MHLTIRPKPFIIPEYSLTGDLFSYLSCGLQYRYHNKGSLPPSIPVQLWFGEFIHSVMEESYLEWKEKDKKSFPWKWNPDIRGIEVEIYTRLAARGLNAPLNLFCPYDESKTTPGMCKDSNHPHKLIASRRVEAAINKWGKHLFPLIDEAEIKLKGTRPIQKDLKKIARSEYYGVKGVVDVISSVSMRNIPKNNLIIDYLLENPDLITYIRNLDSYEYEIIIDYKGMTRPSNQDATWKHHEWQILTYSMLRSKQPDSKKIVAGIIFYLNELELSEDNMDELKHDVIKKSTDIMPDKIDHNKIIRWRKGHRIPDLSSTFREIRSIRVIQIEEEQIENALHQFEKTVKKIESSVFKEIQGQNIKEAWDPPEYPKESTCTVCDFKTICPHPSTKKYKPTVP